MVGAGVVVEGYNEGFAAGAGGMIREEEVDEGYNEGFAAGGGGMMGGGGWRGIMRVLQQGEGV